MDETMPPEELHSRLLHAQGDTAGTARSVLWGDRCRSWRATLLLLVALLASVGAVTLLPGGSMKTTYAGNWNLTVENGSTESFSVHGIMPGHSGNAATWTVKNNSSVDGMLNVTLLNATDTEGINPESETETDPSNGGELAESVEITIYFDELNDDRYTPGMDRLIYDGTPDAIAGTRLSNYELPAGESRELRIDYELPVGVGNRAQGDTAGFDIEFGLKEARDDRLR